MPRIEYDKPEYLLQHLAAVMEKQAEQILQEQLGIGTSQYRLLWVLIDQDAVKQRFIATTLGQTEASISRQVKLLGEKGLLSVQPDPRSKRQVLVRLTPKGHKLYQAAMVLVGQYFNNDYAALKPKHFQQMLDALATLHASLCRPGNTGACDHFLQQPTETTSISL